ncbi:CLP1 [Candida pseudojiufengensis]|uniref:CLP1 n=1 Tax=Candida pseudojiufengensis TaxID=497109 RepID=UPI002224C87F|nr:CLP1 [Candida pseudojiufengensis]KAI5959473.1 CLP1 [Candida pseudojiufengensis]
MSIPGFGGSDSFNEDNINIKTITIPSLYEWRIEIPFSKILKFKIIEGICEINGTELPNNIEIKLTGTKTCIYSPKIESKLEYLLVNNNDTSIMISNDDEDNEFTEYLSKENNMESIINLHSYLESKRQLCQDHNISNEEQIWGPRVLVIGSKQSGKTTLIKNLINYSVKMNQCPILVNLNPQDGVFALPGSISATPINDFLDVESYNGYGLTTTTTGSTLQTPKQPIVKNYGFTNIYDNLDLYKYQISQLGITVLSRLENDLKVKNSGIIVDTPPLSIKDFAVIENIISDFRIDLVVVIENEKLLINLTKKLKHKINNGLQIVKIKKNQGVVELNDKFIRMTQELAIKEYFNGNSKTRLSPFKTDIDANGLKIFKGILTKDLINSLSFLPAGDDFEKDSTKKENELEKYYKLIENPSSSNLDNSIITITQLEQSPQQQQSGELGKELLNASVLGYIHVSKFDDDKKKLKVLLPFPGIFPRNILISTSIGYNE